MADYLKRSALPPAQASEDVRRTVAEILSDIDRRGEPALRDWSLRLDGWAPDSFTVAEAELRAAAAAVPDKLKGHIAFAQDQVRGFAERQRSTLATRPRK